MQLVKDASISIEGKDQQDKKALLQKCASTTLNSKLVSFSHGMQQTSQEYSSFVGCQHSISHMDPVQEAPYWPSQGHAPAHLSSGKPESITLSFEVAWDVPSVSPF